MRLPGFSPIPSWTKLSFSTTDLPHSRHNENRCVTTIIDHLGRPFQGIPEEHAIIVRWARFNHVVMKLALIPERHEYPHRDIRPVIRQLTDAFGPERMIYGGGFKGAETTGNSYRAFREHVASFLGHLSDAGRAQIFGGTASRLFGFKTA